jgi:hypothetical protein
MSYPLLHQQNANHSKNEIQGGPNMLGRKNYTQVVKLNIGDRIRLAVEEFERLPAGFFAELKRSFLKS